MTDFEKMKRVWTRWKSKQTKNYLFLLEVIKQNDLSRKNLNELAKSFTTPKNVSNFVSCFEHAKSWGKWFNRVSNKPIIYELTQEAFSLISDNAIKPKSTASESNNFFPDETYENIPEWNYDNKPRCFKNICAPGDDNWLDRVKEEEKYLQLLLGKHKNVTEGFKFIGYTHKKHNGHPSSRWSLQFEDFRKGSIKKTENPRVFSLKANKRRIVTYNVIIPSRTSRIPYPKENILHSWIEDGPVYLVADNKKIHYTENGRAFRFSRKHSSSHREQNKRILCMTGSSRDSRNPDGYGGLSDMWHGRDGYSGIYTVVLAICLYITIDYKPIKLRRLI